MTGARSREGEDESGPQMPQKKHFRSRAHSNVLNANDFWFPARPQDVPWGEYFPQRASGERAKTFPSQLVLGIEIRPKLVEYVQKRALALRHEAAQATAADAADAATYENVWALHNNAMRFMPNFFEKGQLSKIFICFPDPHFKRKNHRKRIISQPLLAEFGYTLSAGGHL
ncbi:hypothetical protein EMIHUDRAFT_125646, partial [Emiliania huxleyi CCMP1516]